MPPIDTPLTPDSGMGAYLSVSVPLSEGTDRLTPRAMYDLSMAVCISCHRARRLDQLLLVSEVGRPWDAFYCCRPSLDGFCFRTRVRGASVHAIAAAAGGSSQGGMAG